MHRSSSLYLYSHKHQKQEGVVNAAKALLTSQFVIAAFRLLNPVGSLVAIFKAKPPLAKLE